MNQQLLDIQQFIGETARPLAILLVGVATAVGVVAGWVDVAKLTAAGAILVALYGSKSLEQSAVARSQSKVGIAEAQRPPASPEPPK